jgi:hypothetical protein
LERPGSSGPHLDFQAAFERGADRILAELQAAFVFAEGEARIGTGVQALLDALADDEILLEYDTNEVVVLGVVFQGAL